MKIGVIDTGIVGQPIIKKRCFLDQEVEPISRGHGSQIAEIIASHVDAALEIYDAQAFAEGQATTAHTIAEALSWLCEEGVCIVNMSFGLVADRDVLSQACWAASQSGVILVASTPPTGQKVYPAAYDTVLAVCGDARCRPDQLSVLSLEKLTIGAAVGGVGHRAHERGGGASYAAAHVTGLLAKNYRSGATPLQLLQPHIEFAGREKKRGA